MTTKWLVLRAEAVNLYQTIMDTEDLSTVRGSGLMVLELAAPVKEAVKKFATSADPTLITSGASQVVVQFQTRHTSTAQTIADNVAEELRRHRLLRYATLTVDAVEADGELDALKYRGTIESLLAMNRWRQLHSARVSPIGLLDEPDQGLDVNAVARLHNRPWCPVDQVRPAVVAAENVRNERKSVVSRSVADRRRNGFVEKQQEFYRRECGWSPKVETVKRMEIAWDLHQIATFDISREYKDLQHPFLDGKIAIIHADGNKFGKYQMERVVGPKTQAAWDERVQNLRREALKKILHAAWDPQHPDWIDPLWWNRNDAESWRLRLETLLWGGDEFIWVVPAWQGLKVVEFIFETYQPPSDAADQPDRPRPLVKRGKSQIRNLDARPSKKEREEALRQRDDPRKIASLNLTLSAGVAFCHANAPIRRTRQLAQRLTDLAKQSTGSGQNAFCYAVLESFDQMEESVLDTRIRQLPFGSGNVEETFSRLKKTAVEAAQLTNLLEAIRWMRDHFPRGAVYRILKELRQDNLQDAQKWLDRGLHELDDGQLRQGKQHLAMFRNEDPLRIDDAHRINWLHLAELWDYTV